MVIIFNTDSIKSYWTKKKKGLKKFFSKVKKPSIVYGIILIASVVFIPMIIYFIAWTYQFIINNQLVKFSDLKDLIHEALSGPAVVFYVFILKCLIDKDGDGYPDQLEDNKDNDSTTTTVESMTGNVINTIKNTISSTKNKI